MKITVKQFRKLIKEYLVIESASLDDILRDPEMFLAELSGQELVSLRHERPLMFRDFADSDTNSDEHEGLPSIHDVMFFTADVEPFYEMGLVPMAISDGRCLVFIASPTNPIVWVYEENDGWVNV